MLEVDILASLCYNSLGKVTNLCNDLTLSTLQIGCQLNIFGQSLHKQSQFAHFTMIEVCIQEASL